MKNKKGFISISIIYSFFVVILLFLVLIMSAYIHNRFTFNIFKNDIKKNMVSTTEPGEDESNFLSTHIVNLESSTAYYSSQDESLYRVYQEQVIYGSDIIDAGIRYEGKDPDNYIIFNNELWRIIGVFESSTLGLEEGKYFTKIIRDESIGNMAWDDSYNDWENAQLNTYLNGTYYNSLINKDLIFTNAKWYLRGDDKAADITTHESYIYERYTGMSGLNGVVATESQGAIGLMYPSDYGYAGYGDGCSVSEFTLSDYSTGDCNIVNWLAQKYWNISNEWLITPSSYSNSNDKASILFTLSHAFVSIDTVTNANLVRPTLYLNYDVEKLGGDGSKDRPYIISESIQSNLSNKILSLESTDDYMSSQNGTIYRVVEQNGVRYEGESPDNYIIFNDEKWRIIGAFEGSTIGLEAGKYYTKILKSDHLNPLDVSLYNSINNWESSNLNKYLNGEYYNSLGSESKNMIQMSMWYLGNFYDPYGPNPQDYNGWYAAGLPDAYEYDYNSYQAYLLERKTGVKTTTNNISLIYVSDYGYSAYSSFCDNLTTMPLNWYEEPRGVSCASASWIYQNTSKNFLFLNPSIDHYVNAISSTGWVNSETSPMGAKIYPTLYLSNEVYIISGTGTKDDPYVLGL